MKKITQVTIYTCLTAVFAVTAGSVVMAQTYNWIPIGTIGAKWSSNGSHIYSTNSGSVVVGDNYPSSTLKLDVNGSVGATLYCDQNGNNCYRPLDASQWVFDAINNDLHTKTTTTEVGVGVVTPTQKLHVGGNVLADAYLYSSDINLKENISPLNGLDIISQLSGVRFSWKGHRGTGSRSNSPRG